MQEQLKNIALLAPVFTTLFWGILLLLNSRGRDRPTRFIGTLMLIFFLIFASLYPYFTGNLRMYIFLEPVFFLGQALIFPLVWFYVRSISHNVSMTSMDIVHFIPAALLFLACLLLLIFMPYDKYGDYALDSLHRPGDSSSPHILYVLNYISKFILFLQVIYYFIRSAGLIRGFRIRINDHFSGLNSAYFNWICLFYFSYPGAALMALMLNFTGNRELHESRDNLLVGSFLLLSALIFIIAYVASRQVYIDEQDFFEDQSAPFPEEAGPVPVEAESLALRFDQYILEKKPWMEPDLKITDLAFELNSNRTYISSLIHSRYHSNFRTFINVRRVEEVIRMFGAAAYRNHSTRSIAEAAGFNSYNTFVQAFRRETGQTPGQYRKEYQK